MSRNTRNYSNQKGRQQSTDDRKKTSTVASGQAASGKNVYDELFPPLSTSSTVLIAGNPPLSTGVNIHPLFSDCLDHFIF
jgi:hypothetical protein